MLRDKNDSMIQGKITHLMLFNITALLLSLVSAVGVVQQMIIMDVNICKQ